MKDLINVLYLAAVYLCDNIKHGEFMPLACDFCNFRIYPDKVTLISKNKKNVRRCLQIFLYSNRYNPISEIKVKFENDKLKLFNYSEGGYLDKKKKKFIETNEWKWLMDNLKIKIVEML